MFILFTKLLYVKWWLQFQRDFQGKVSFGCESLYNSKSSVTQEDLHSKNNPYAKQIVFSIAFMYTLRFEQLFRCTNM